MSVCDRMGKSMKVDSVVAAVELYEGLGFRVTRTTSAGAQIKSTMVRPKRRGLEAQVSVFWVRGARVARGRCRLGR
jgi:hypothetical protein